MLNPDPTNRLNTAPPLATHNPTPAESQLCNDVHQFCRDVDEARGRLLREWEIIKCYMDGDQHLWKNTAGELVRVRNKQKRLESTNNQLLLAERQLHAKLTKFIPEFDAEASNGDQDELQGALAASAFLQFFKYKEEFEIQYMAAMHGVARYGAGVHYLDYNPNAGKRYAACPVCGYADEDDIHVGEECPACHFDHQNSVAQYEQAAVNAEELVMRGMEPVDIGPPPVPNIGILEPLYEGDIELLTIHSAEFYPENGTRDVKDMGMWAIRRPVNVPEARERYPEYADVIGPKPGLYSLNNVKTATQTSAGSFQYDEYKNQCVETRLFHKPSAGYPRGRLIITINDDIVVYDGENPLFFLQRPNVFYYTWYKTQDDFWALPFATQARHRQKELNENERQQRENSELLSNGKLVIFRNSGVRPGEVNATTGQNIVVTTGMTPPHYLRAPELPATAWQRGGILKSSIMEHAHISAAEQGVMSGDISGRALAIVQAEADQNLGPTYKQIWSEVAALHKCVLLASRVFYSSDKQYHVRGEMGLQVYTMADMELWQGRNLRIVPEDGLSKNQQTRLQNVMQLASLPGMFSNPQTGMIDVPRLVKAAKIRIAGIGGDVTQAQHAHAHYMLRQIEQFDFSVRPEMVDDPLIHGQVFHFWLQTKGYNPKVHPQVKAFVTQYFQFYVEMANYLQNPEMGVPPMAPQGQNQSAPSGAGMGSGGQNAAPTMQTASNIVMQADRAAERTARAANVPHEGPMT